MPLAGILFLFVLQAYGQDVNTGNLRFSARFLSDTMELQPGKYGFNSLRITNLSDQPLQLKTELHLPMGWSVMSPLPASVELKPGENRVLPIRVKSGESTLGGRVYHYSVLLEDLLTGQSRIQRVGVTLSLASNWKADLEEYVKYTADDEPLPDFRFKIANEGTRVELYEVEFETDFRLTLPAKGTQVLLKPGQDTLITAGIRSRTLNQTDGIVFIHIHSRQGTRTLQQRVHILSNEYRANHSDRYIFPVHLRGQGLSLVSAYKPSYVLEADGTMQLAPKRFLSFTSRSYFLNNQLNFNTSLYRVHYQGRRAEVELGSIQDFVLTSVMGYGSRVGFRQKRQSVEFAAVSPLIYKGANFILKQNLGFGRSSELQTEALWSRNGESGVTSAFALHTLRWRPAKTGNMALLAGYSHEKAAGIGKSFPGYMLGYQAQINHRFVTLSSIKKINSSWFPGLNRGLDYQNHDVFLRFGLLKLGGYGIFSRREPYLYNSNFTRAEILQSSKNSDYGFQAGIGGLRVRAGKYSIFQMTRNSTTTPEYGQNPVVSGTKLSVGYFLKLGLAEQLIQLDMVNAGFENEQGKQGTFKTYNAYLNGHYKSLGYSFRYNNGPVYYLDYLFYYRTGTWQNRHQHSIYYNTNTARKLRGRASVNYFMTTGLGSRELTFQNDLEWDIPSRGFSVSVGSSINLLGRGERPFLTASLSKNLNVPVPFFRKYRNMRIRMFKDANNNGNWDIGEEAVKGANISVDGKYLRSDELGLSKLSHAERKSYVINFSHITNQVGWMPETLLSDSIYLDKDKEVLIPFKSTKVVMGQITYETTDYAMKRAINLGGLRIVAVDKDGKETETVSTEDGGFYFNLLPGVYTIKMPVDAAGSSLYFPVSELQADLLSQDLEQLKFTLKDRGRKLNIRKSED